MQVVLWLVRHHLRGYNPLQTASLTHNLTLPEGVSLELSEFCAPAGRTAQLLVELGVTKLRCRSLPCLCSALELHSSSWQEAIGDASAGQVARGALQTCTDRGGEGRVCLGIVRSPLPCSCHNAKQSLIMCQGVQAGKLTTSISVTSGEILPQRLPQLR